MAAFSFQTGVVHNWVPFAFGVIVMFRAECSKAEIWRLRGWRPELRAARVNPNV